MWDKCGCEDVKRCMCEGDQVYVCMGRYAWHLQARGPYQYLT